MSIQEHAPAPADKPKEELSEEQLRALAGDYEYSTPVVDTPPQDPATRAEARKAEAPKRKLPKWALPVALAGVVAIGGTAGTVAVLNQPAVVEEGDPGDGITDPVTEPDNGEGTPVTNPEVITVESETLPTGLSNEQLADYVVTESLTRWANAGQTQETRDAYITFLSNGEGAVGDFALAEAAKYRTVFGTALFGPAFESDTAAVEVVDLLTKRNAVVLQNWLITFNDSKPFNFSTSSESVVIEPIDDSSFKSTIVEVVSNNSGENRIGTEYPNDGLPKDGEKIGLTIVINTSGSSPVIQSFGYSAAN